MNLNLFKFEHLFTCIFETVWYVYGANVDGPSFAGMKL